MIDTLIVIATHGGVDLLKQSLPKMGKWPIAVVETGDLTPAVFELCNATDNAVYLNTPYRGYDTGAYLWAFFHLPARRYLFLQDSCWPHDADFVEQFAAKMPDSDLGAVGWSSFDINIWDSNEQRIATEFMYGDQKKWPKQGIFGPIFYTSHKALSTLRLDGLLPMPPVHKQQQQAMERAWPICFYRAGMDVRFLLEEYEPRGAAMSRGDYPALTKTFRRRT